MLDTLYIGGSEYARCGLCLTWRPLDEMTWSNALLAWVCTYLDECYCHSR
jgi:hypothetical protein